ncbi:hypothetical protein KUTeg_011515 [Tegillarca granosa]|uniref:Uncharacterized protein n=1 Tax=Tegillarca granosa TaxID=220873 RepID=A0ABQ9F5R0_TEGGR|nr:hypothetical protein KUTeg_011515 [Tegillarca granosa]
MGLRTSSISVKTSLTSCTFKHVQNHCQTQKIVPLNRLNITNFRLRQHTHSQENTFYSKQICSFVFFPKGFGYHLAKRLDDNGFIVYAGVLKPNGDGACALKLRKSKNLKVLKLDVTSDDDVKDAVAFVHKNKTGLWGIVNNAGFNIYGDVEICFIDHYKQVLDCDLYGQIRIIKSFLPLIRKSKGRIVNISSVMGLYACPGDSIYHTAKAGVEAFTQCLRYEMIKFGVRVSVVEPGWYDKATSCSSPEQLQRIRSNLNEIYNIIADSGTGDAATSPEPVLAAIEDALINVNSQYRYLVGGSSRWIDPAAAQP